MSESKSTVSKRREEALIEKLHALFYSKNNVNWPGTLAEEVAPFVVEEIEAAVAAERERAEGKIKAFEELAKWPYDWILTARLRTVLGGDAS